jgi:DNA mismatch endonuclease (patch repair protein)
VPQDQFSKEQRSWIMSRVKGRNTTPEIKLRQALWRKGLRYRVNVDKLPGKPDIVFFKVKVAIFVDGDFWHGKKLSATRLWQMSDYWRNKINRNVNRDAKNNALLTQMGYSVLRYLESEISGNLHEIVTQITQTIKEKHLRD